MVRISDTRQDRSHNRSAISDHISHARLEESSEYTSLYFMKSLIFSRSERLLLKEPSKDLLSFVLPQRGFTIAPSLDECQPAVETHLQTWTR